MARTAKRSKDPSHLKRIEGIKIRRKILVLAMGGACQFCGTTRGLEFHHLKERSWVCRDASRWVRQRIYEEEWSKGLLKLACGDCNKRLGQPSSQPDFEPDF